MALIWLDRRCPVGRRVFPAMLAVSVLARRPALAGWTDGPLWQRFAHWFGALPLT